MSGDPTGIPLDIQGELAQRGLSGKLTVIAEGLPTGGALSAGTNKWDGTWSLGLDDLSGLCFIAPTGQTGGHTLTIRVLRLDLDTHGFEAATTVALFDMRVGDGAKAAPAAKAPKARKQRGRPIKKGRSGKPAGRSQGSRNKATLAVEALLDGEVEGLTRKVIDLALDGDTTALRLCLDRLCPPRKDRLVSFKLPPMKAPADAVAAMSALLAAVAKGKVTPGGGANYRRLDRGAEPGDRV